MTEHTHTTNTCAINSRNGIDTYLPHAVGVGFKPQHLSAIMKDSSGVDWLEIHAENYMIDGGPRKAMLEQLAMDFPISCHVILVPDILSLITFTICSAGSSAQFMTGNMDFNRW